MPSMVGIVPGMVGIVGRTPAVDEKV